MGAGTSTNAGDYVFAEFGGAAGSRAAAAAAAGGGGAAAAAVAPAEGVRGFISPFPGSPEEPATHEQIRKWKEELPNASKVPNELQKNLKEIKSKLEKYMTREIRSGQDRINKKYYTGEIERLTSQYEDALAVYRLDESRRPGTPDPAPREVAPQTLDDVKVQVQVALKRAQQVSARGVGRQTSSENTLISLIQRLLEFPDNTEASILIAEIRKALSLLSGGDIYEPSDEVKKILPGLGLAPGTLSTLRF